MSSNNCLGIFQEYRPHVVNVYDTDSTHEMMILPLPNI